MATPIGISHLEADKNEMASAGHTRMANASVHKAACIFERTQATGTTGFPNNERSWCRPWLHHVL
jgi:hypothetical protein